MEYHNICRHQCGIEDVGDLKINALKRKLLNINPQIDVQIFEGIVQNIPKAVLDDFCVKGKPFLWAVQITVEQMSTQTA